MTNCKENLVNYKDFSCNATHTTVAVANNEKLICSGVRDLMVNFGNEVRQLKNVLFVPQIATNLISVSKLVESGLTIEFGSHGCSIYDSKVSGNRLALVGCKNGIYKLNCNIVKSLHNKVYSSKLLSNGQKTEYCSCCFYSAVASQIGTFRFEKYVYSERSFVWCYVSGIPRTV